MNDEIGITLNYIQAVIKLPIPKEKQNTWLKNNCVGIFIFQGIGNKLLKMYGYC